MAFRLGSVWPAHTKSKLNNDTTKEEFLCRAITSEEREKNHNIKNDFRVGAEKKSKTVVTKCRY